jgi:cytochrome P450
MDPGVWCKDPRTPPVDVFYPGRFLKPTGIGKDAALEFSTKAFEGSWIPFGSGANICPGRNFAKMHAILTVAMMVDSFDCDVLAPQPKLDLTKFGMGVLGPKRAVPVRIKRREGL